LAGSTPRKSFELNITTSISHGKQRWKKCLRAGVSFDMNLVRIAFTLVSDREGRSLVGQEHWGLILRGPSARENDSTWPQ
jgi:hypothetical protein